MTQTTGYVCPRCRAPLEKTANFCANCGADISGVWSADGEPLGKTIAVEIDQQVDQLAQLLTNATLGDYDVYGELGRGGMAAVYLGLDLALNRKVAIKTMLPELLTREGMVERFKREAQTAAALSHPHIIQIYTVKQTKELVYFVMKFIEGRSLESVIIEKGQLSVDMTRMVLSQVASALAYAHRKHVIHRDIKPANIMIDEDGWAIVTDFGIAKVQEAQNLTATGTAIGTPHYMSPEQFHNKAITGASDQYSLGIVAYEMLLGRKPFDGATYAEIITQHLFEQPGDIRAARPDVPEHIAAAVMRMLAKDPAERFADLDAVAHELGVPQKTDGVVVRTEMISLAKNGPQKKVRMSVPISPVPMTKRNADPAAPTVVEKPAKARRPRPTAAPEKSRRTPLVAAAATAFLAVGGYFGWQATRGESPTGAPAAAPTQSAPVAQVTDSQRPPPVADSEAATKVAVTPAGQAADSIPVRLKPEATRPVFAPPPAPGPARIVVSNVPSGGIVTVDGRRQSSRDVSLRAGSHTVRIEARGFETMTQRLTVAAGERREVTFDRRPRAVATTPAPARPAAQQQSQAQSAAGLAVLRISISPPATLIVDDQNKGQQSRYSEELIPGTHKLRIERNGFLPKDTLVTLAAGPNQPIRIQLTQRP